MTAIYVGAELIGHPELGVAITVPVCLACGGLLQCPSSICRLPHGRSEPLAVMAAVCRAVGHYFDDGSACGRCRAPKRFNLS